MEISFQTDDMMYDISPVEFDPFADEANTGAFTAPVSDQQIPPASETIPVDFDPFAGPQIALLAPVTESQAEIWTSCLIGGEPANCAYNECFSLVLTGILSKNALMNALLDVVQMHEALRTTFSPDGSNTIISSETLLDIDYQDIAHLSPEEQKKLTDQYNQKLVLQPFDLANGPLFKTALFKITETEHLLTFVAHHIICDGWSIGIMLQDLGNLYSLYAQHKPVTVPRAPLFSAYAAEQLSLKDSPAYHENENYWLEQFKGSNHLMDLPVDYPRPAVRTYKSHRLDLKLNAELAAGIKNMGKTSGAGFVTTLMAAFEVFLKKLTGQNEIIIGLPAAGQSATENFRLVGHCVNLLALRSFPDGNLSFKTYLKTRKSQILDAYDHQQYTFGSLLKKLNIPRNPSRLPLVPIMFNIDMGLDNDVAFYGLNHRLISNPREYENFEIFLNIAGYEESPTLEWSYNTALFKASTIEKMMESFEFVLQQVVNDPDLLIGKLPAQDAAETLTKLNKWNATAYHYPAQKSVHALIAEQAVTHPDKIALAFGNEQVNYTTLNQTANQLAAYLIANGVKKGDKIALSIDRSVYMVTCLLAIMKTGAVYVPLDPQFPLNRINYMLEDSQAVILLTGQQYKGHYQSNAKEIVVEDVWPTLGSYPVTDPAVDVCGNDLVYILYTSGSTGMPKGVQIAHHNLVNFLISMQNQPGLTADDKLLAVTTISFDIAGLELFLPLITGAQIVLADSASAKDGRELLRIIKKEQISVMQATPYTWRIMLEAGWDAQTPLKVICGGEALPLELADRILNTKSSLWNVYGPTETTVWSTVKQITGTDRNISVGRPINNTTVYILDDFLNPLAPGVPGEIFIGGDGVAKGYLNRPELTAEKFVADPFCGIPGATMYRTGDVGKFRPDGEIDCLGRIDSQVKIRGYRIETGEIEFQLSKIEHIREAVVIPRADKNGIDKLVAFVVMEKGMDLAVPSWKEILKNNLPDYMVPDNFVVVPVMPLTPNGKIDKKELAKQELSATTDETAYLPPVTENEKLIAGIWAECLGIADPGINDNFFELGGHSLIAVKVMAAIEKQTGKVLPLASLFTNPNIHKLAQLLEPDDQSVSWASLVPIKPTGNKMPLYMVHGAGLNVLLFNTLAANMSADQPVYGLQAKGLDGIDEPLDKLEDIAAHYISEIISQNPTGPYALAGYSFGGIIAYEMARQLTEMGREVKMLAMFDTYAYRSPYYDPALLKFYKRARFFKDKVLYTFKFENGLRGVKERVRSVKRKIILSYWKLRYGKEQKQEGFFGYSNKVDQMNSYASRYYQLKPQNITLELFRAQERTFYMDDFENLGWKPYALNGVNIHSIPGEHNTIFKAPNDKIFAQVLQKCLDDAAKK